MDASNAQIDFSKIQRVLDRFSRAQTAVQLEAALPWLAAALHLPHYLALDIIGLRPQVCRVLHNLPGVDTGAVAQCDLATQLRGRPIPLAMNRNLPVAGLQFGIAASALHGHRACLLFIGGPTATLDAGLLSESRGAAALSATHLLAAFVRLSRASCPLSARELQCLGLTAQGLSAKQTARRLGISHRTVEDHLRYCRAQLKSPSSLHAAVQALSNGWLEWTDVDAAGFGPPPTH